MSKLHKILRYPWPWLSCPPLATMPYAMYFRFCEWYHIFT